MRKFMMRKLMTPEFIIRCAPRYCVSVFARASLVLFLLAVCAAEIPAAMPATPWRSAAADRAPSSSGAPVENSAAQITFRKVFKTSYPEFVEIKINQAGTGSYDIRQLDEDANPQPFAVSPPLASRPQFARSPKALRAEGVSVLVGPGGTAPPGTTEDSFPWHLALDEAFSMTGFGG